MGYRHGIKWTDELIEEEILKVKKGLNLKRMPTTLTTCFLPNIVDNLRIRKLTPKECFRLMGVKDEDYEKLSCSNAQKYKQAGNSIVVNVLEEIFKELL